jgi:uncharacterized surface protein with fasciclin (FAS1) repeats
MSTNATYFASLAAHALASQKTLGDANSKRDQRKHRFFVSSKELTRLVELFKKSIGVPMKKFVMTLVSIAFSATAALAAPTSKNIVQIAAGDPQFSTLVELVKEAGLAETLSGPGPFTLFAPTNEAFGKVDAATLTSLKQTPQKLAAVLKYHVVAGKVPASQVVTMKSAASVEGSSIAVSAADGKVKVDNATITATDIMGTNGVIHVIDSVILPAE